MREYRQMWGRIANLPSLWCTLQALHSGSDHGPCAQVSVGRLRKSLDCAACNTSGTRTYGDDASPEKRARAIRRAEERGSLTLGLAFSGLSALEEDGRVFCVPGGSRAPAGFQYPKTIADYTKLLRMFLASAGTTEQQCGLAGQFARKATDLSELFARLTVVNLYGSSVLLGYDAAAGNHPFGASTEERDLVSSAELKLIDFAHVSVLPETPDPGFSLGIDNLKTVLKSVITELKQEEAKKSAQ